MTGSVDGTYVAALRHDLFDPGGATLVRVVRRPTGWFRTTVGENRPTLGPPAVLLDETKERAGTLKQQGLCDEGAHNASWEVVEFERRYCEYLGADSEAGDALADLLGRVDDGGDLALVRFEGDGKRCHRHTLVERAHI